MLNMEPPGARSMAAATAWAMSATLMRETKLLPSQGMTSSPE